MEKFSSSLHETWHLLCLTLILLITLINFNPNFYTVCSEDPDVDDPQEFCKYNENPLKEHVEKVKNSNRCGDWKSVLDSDSFMDSIINQQNNQATKLITGAKAFEADQQGYGRLNYTSAWTVMIRTGSDTRGFCSGVIIDKDLVMTLASCVDRKSTMTVYAGYISENTFEYEYKVKYIVESSNYDRKSNAKFKPFDYAILQLEDQFRYTDLTSPICLPTFSSEQNFQRYRFDPCFVGGYGVSGQFYALDFTSRECKDYTDRSIRCFSKFLTAPAESVIRPICNGDRGGPVMCRAHEDDKWYLIGLSYGPEEGRVCDPDSLKPNRFVDIYAMRRNIYRMKYLIKRNKS